VIIDKRMTLFFISISLIGENDRKILRHILKSVNTLLGTVEEQYFLEKRG
jgi:hypothetical protein